MAGSHVLKLATKTTTSAPSVEKLNAAGIPSIPWGVRAGADLATDRGNRFSLTVNWNSEYNNTCVTTAGADAIETVGQFASVDAQASIGLPPRFGLSAARRWTLRSTKSSTRRPPPEQGGQRVPIWQFLGRVAGIGLRGKF